MVEGKTVEIGGKRFIINKAPATVAYEIAIRSKQIYQKSKDKDEDVEEQMICLNKLLKYVEVDLGDGRKMALSSDSVINQHITNVQDLIELQKEVMAVNFDFFMKENHSDS